MGLISGRVPSYAHQREGGGNLYSLTTFGWDDSDESLTDHECRMGVLLGKVGTSKSKAVLGVPAQMIDANTCTEAARMGRPRCVWSYFLGGGGFWSSESGAGVLLVMS